MSETKDILFDFIDIWGKENQIYSKVCTVKSVDSSKKICDCSPIDGSADILEVLLEGDISINSEKEPITSDSKGFFVVPAVGSLVIVTFTGKENAFVSAWTEISDIVIKSTNITSIQDQFIFNDGSLGGLIKIEALTGKLNDLVNEITSLKTKLDTHTHTGVTVGTGITGIPTPFIQNFTSFNKNDYENTKIKH